MRDEFDFSNAVRGKYAERFRDGVRFAETPPVQALMYEDLLHWVGAALREVQQVEVFLTSFLALDRRLNPNDAVKAAMDGLRTAEDVSALWSESSSAHEDDVSRLLRRLVPFRSWLVHSSLHCLVPELDQPNLVATLERLEAETKSASTLRRRLAVLARKRARDELATPDERTTFFRKVSDAVAGAAP